MRLHKLFLLVFLLISGLFLIACDNVSFDRATIISLDSMGGESLEPIEFDQDEFIELPVPTREGHTFLGWYRSLDDDTPFMHEDDIKGRLTLYAKWSVNRYTLTFETGDGTPVDEITLDFGMPIRAPQPENGVFFLEGWYDDLETGERFVFDTMPAENHTLHANWIYVGMPTFQHVDQFPIVFQGEVYDPLDGVIAYDLYDGDLTHEIRIEGNDDTSYPGTHTIRLAVTNSHGRTTRYTILLTVVESS